MSEEEYEALSPRSREIVDELRKQAAALTHKEREEAIAKFRKFKEKNGE